MQKANIEVLANGEQREAPRTLVRVSLLPFGNTGELFLGMEGRA